MGNVVIVTHWLDGDVIPFVRIGKELRKRGHSVVLITHCHFEEMARKAGLEFEPWDTPEEYSELVEAMGNNKDNVQQKNYTFSSSSFRQKYENIAVRLKEYEKIYKHCQKPGTVILCKNRSSVAAYMVAEKMGLPLATVMMNPTEITSMLMYEQLEGNNDLPRLNELRKDRNLEKIDSWLQWESSAKMTLALWPKWYEYTEAQEWPSEIEEIGFPLESGKEAFAREIPGQFSEWLSNNPNPIVISGGTTKCIENSFYKVCVEGCALSGQPTVVLTRYRELLPETLPDNVVWYEYLPLDMILPKISLLIHHGGMGTLSGALAAGIPQLILPCFVDRPYNASLVKKLGAGDFLNLANWQPDKIYEKILQLQTEEVRKVCCSYAAKMKENCGISAAADHVEKLMKGNKYVYSINRQHSIESIEASQKKASSDNSDIRKQKPEVRNLIAGMTPEQRARLVQNRRKELLK